LNPAVDHTIGLAGLRPNAVNRVLWDRERAGGKALNVASCLAQMDCRVAITGFLGRDNGEVFDRFCAARGIQNEFLQRTGSTRRNIKLVDESTREVTDLNAPGLALATEDLAALEHQIEALIRPGTWVVLSGSLPPGVPLDYYATLGQRLQASSCRLCLDASGPALRQGLDAKPELVKPNRHEIEEILGTRFQSAPEWVSAAHHLLAGGVRFAAISLGSEGAIVAGGGEAFWVRPGSGVTVTTTVGAGDAFVAGLIAALDWGWCLEDVARWATGVSSAMLAAWNSGALSLEQVRVWAERATLEQVG
jgi:1-phosphofructokinase